MKIQKNQNKIKGAYKQNYSTKIYPNNQLNYKETNEGENLEFQDEQEYEEEEQIDYQKQCYIQPIRAREEFYEKESNRTCYGMHHGTRTGGMRRRKQFFGQLVRI